MANSIWYKLGIYLESTNKNIVILSYNEIIKITGSKATKTIHTHPEFFSDHNRVIFKSITEAGYNWQNNFYKEEVVFFKEK